MAKRPVFVPSQNGFPYVEEVQIEFEWFSGFAKSQAQKSIASQHAAAERYGISPVLEISSKSMEPLGTVLSAFNLMLEIPSTRGTMRMSVECAFQGSKVFERGGPYTDLYDVGSRHAKTDERIRNSGDLIAFDFLGGDFPTKPLTAFYDWLYLTALWQNPDLSQQLSRYRAFSDIAFNPERSFNCQARSAALFVALGHTGDIERAMSEKAAYLTLISGNKTGVQTAAKSNQQLNMPL